MIAIALCLFGDGALSQDSYELEPLLTEFEQEASFVRQLAIAEQIVAQGDDDALPRLERWLNHEDRHIRGNAAFIFAGLGDPRGFQVLYQIIDDRSHRPLGQGIAAIVGNTDTEGWWIPAQIEADRYYAVHLLGQLQDPRAVDVLLPLVADEQVGTKARWALAQIPHVTEARLRVFNSGVEDIENLSVLLPNGSVEFGDVRAGTTTAYMEASGGVYPYAAYRFEIDGRLISQPVIDWAGALPMVGADFTYELVLVTPSFPSPARAAIRLVEVATDR